MSNLDHPVSRVLELWTVQDEQIWQNIQQHGRTTSVHAPDNEWPAPWLTLQMQHRLKDYQGNAPLWGYFRPQLYSLKSLKIQADRILDPGIQYVLIRLRLQSDQVLLVRDGRWADVVNRMYIGTDEADRSRFDDLVYSGDYYYAHPALPAPIVEQIRASWDRVFLSHEEFSDTRNDLVHAIFEAITIDDVVCVTRIYPDSLLYPPYVPGSSTRLDLM